jgi:hypothetical protein
VIDSDEGGMGKRISSYSDVRIGAICCTVASCDTEADYFLWIRELQDEMRYRTVDCCGYCGDVYLYPDAVMRFSEMGEAG